MHLVKTPFQDAEALSRSILHMKESIRLCRKCFGLSDSEICHICANPSRNGRLICVVETVSEMVAIERSGGFVGQYHILQGALSPMDGIGPDDIRIRELLDRVRSDTVAEVILATGTHLEGENTATFIAEKLSRSSVRVSRIASGIPMGGDLRYVDQITIKRAMDNRHAID